MPATAPLHPEGGAAGCLTTMTTLARLASLAILISCSLPSTAAAVRPMGTTMTGTIQSVDHTTRWIVFIQDGGPVRRFVYSEWAKFWHDAADCSPAALRPGMRVQVNLRNPLIGPDFVTQIVLLDQSEGATNPK